MAQINVTVTLDNVDTQIDPQQLADVVESLVKSYTKMEVSTNIFDNDGVETSNPILTHNLMKRIR